MVRVRFAPSPTGSLHVGNALTAVANWRFARDRGGVFLLRIDDTDPVRNVDDGEEEIVSDLGWLGVDWDEGPIRQSDRAPRHRAAVEQLLRDGRAVEEDGFVRFAGERRATLLRDDGTPTYHIATVVDDLDHEITHVIRGADHLPNQPLHEALARALGREPPLYVHHGLLVGPDGAKLSKRYPGSSIAGLRELGLPPEAVRAYLEELGLPRGNVFFDLQRIKRLATQAIAAMSDEELAGRLGVADAVAAVARGAHDLAEARRLAMAVLDVPGLGLVPEEHQPTLARFRELREGAPEALDAQAARALVGELRASGGNLRAVRVALTGAERGPELWTILVALPREEALRRVDAAL